MTFSHGLRLSLFAILAAALAFGCASRGKYKQKDLVLDAGFYYARGMEELERRDYERAIEDFTTVVESFSGSAVVDSALFALAETHFKNEDYITAASEYERVYTDYPSSHFVAEAQYRKAVCYALESPKAQLDQENTTLAIEEFNRFIDNFSQHPLVPEAQQKIEELREKLAYKDFLAAETYRKLKTRESLEAAIISYQALIVEYPRSAWVDDARFGMGQVYAKRKEFLMAKTIFTQIAASEKTDDSLRKKARKAIGKIEKQEKKAAKKAAKNPAVSPDAVKNEQK